MKANRQGLLILKKRQVNTMRSKRITAAFIAAVTSFIPLSSESLSGFISEPVYAEEHGMGAALPNWIPYDLESAIEFRNTYGATHVQDGLVCVVFKEGAKQAASSQYLVMTTEDMMDELAHKTFESKESGVIYETVVYYAPHKQGTFEVALVETAMKDIIRESGFRHAYKNYAFCIDEDSNISETDIYSWFPDSVAEYMEYSEKFGQVSARDNIIVFCIDSNAGTPYDWFEVYGTPRSCINKINHYFTEDCSTETAPPLDGGTIHKAIAYSAEIDGSDLVRWDYASVNDYCSNQVEKTLIADCTITDDAKTVILNDSYVNDAEFSYSQYSIYSDDLNASYTSIYNAFADQKAAVISSKDELVSFLSTYLKEKALNKFVSEYSDSFFENNVLLLNTYLDPYRGRILSHGLDSVQLKDGRLIINYTSIIYANLMRTSYFDILRVVIPKSELQEKVIWNNEETLNFDLKRISIIDEDTGEPISIPGDKREHIFGDKLKYFEGRNPYYLDTELSDFYWPSITVDEDYLPEGYVLSEKVPVKIKEYAYNSADLIFTVKNTSPVEIKYAADKIPTTTPDLISDNIIKGLKPAVAASKEELSGILSLYISEECQKELFSAYDDDFFKENVLFLDFLIDSTGGKRVSIDNTVISSEKIKFYYTRPSADFGICNTDYFFILQAAVPKSSYDNQNAEWKCSGDVNGDGEFGISDLVTLQKWLLADRDTMLSDRKTADICKDNNIDIFDLVAMRKKLIGANKSDVPVKYAIEAQFLRAYRTVTNSGPVVRMMTNTEELESYFSSGHKYEELEKYDDEWFNYHKLMVVSIEEGSGSITHEITDLTSDHVTINCISQEVMTCDMAAWDILIELDKNAVISDNFRVDLTSE